MRTHVHAKDKLIATLSRATVTGLLTGAAALALATGCPAAHAADGGRCPGISAAVHSVQVRGIGCSAADRVIRASLSGQRDPEGFRCRARRAGTHTSVQCRRGAAILSWAATAAGKAQPAPPTEARDTLKIDSAVAAPLSEPIIEEGAQLSMTLSVTDRYPSSDVIEAYVLGAGQACDWSHDSVTSAAYQQELYQSVQVLVANYLGYSDYEEGPYSGTFSATGETEVDPLDVTVCVMLVNASEAGAPTLATAEAPVTTA